ncbi:MAG: nucleotidyltransferase domain-containing protein [Patescibacteria group bacterium]
MRLEHYSQEKLKKEILEIVGKYLDLKKYKVFFFGSRVSGKGNERSDIDIGIEGPEKISNSIIFNIKDEVENLTILYRIDIVNFTDASKKFLEVASQFKQYIN